MLYPPAEDHEDGLTQLLLKLPAELRLEIYQLCLGPIPYYLDIKKPGFNLQWLATSRTIFEEAAPLLYSNTAIYFDVEVPANDPEILLDQHVKNNYGIHAQWAKGVICRSFVRKAMFELWCPMLYSIEEILWELNSKPYFELFQSLGQAKEISISLRDVRVSTHTASILKWSEGTDSGIREAVRYGKPESLRLICRILLQILEVLGDECHVRWNFRGEMLPEVSFLRKGVPEQKPTEKETSITQFLDRMCRFIRETPRDEMNISLHRAMA